MLKKTVTTFCILTLLPWKKVITGPQCSVAMEFWDRSMFYVVMTLYRAKVLSQFLKLQRKLYSKHFYF